jgi:TRIAD3 protein (E3 ubiquitin-protein ligase RNF216)
MNVKSYHHFAGNGGNGTCPLHDNTEKRHQEEVEKAEKAALETIQILMRMTSASRSPRR